MSRETADFVLGTVLLIASLPALYYGARVISNVDDRWHAYRLMPLARSMAAEVQTHPPCILVHHRGYAMRASYGDENIGDGDAAMRMHAFYLSVPDQPGATSWCVRFCSTGLFAQGPKEPLIEVSDTALGLRLEALGVLDEIKRVCVTQYACKAVEYDVHARRLTLIDDVMPNRLPEARHLPTLLDLTAWLVEANQKANPIHSTSRTQPWR